MVQERIDIVISEKGSRVVKRRIKEIGTESKKSFDAVAALKTGLLAIGGAVLISQLVGIADAFTQIQNRLRLVTNTTAQVVAVGEELLNVSNRTRTSFQVNAELYNRVALATRELGTTQGQVLRVIESVNQAVLISGASAKEANNGLIQLSQGLASGALRGDELRSVLEQLPAVADVLAKQLGVTRGQLRAMGADFKITSQVILEGFENAREELEERFARVIPTVEQSLVVLGNTFTEFFGKLTQETGVATGLSKAILAVARNLGDVTSALVLLAAVGTASFFAPMVSSANRAIDAYRKVRTAVKAGQAVIIGSTQATMLQTAAISSNAAAQVAATRAAINQVVAEKSALAASNAMAAAKAKQRLVEGAGIKATLAARKASIASLATRNTLLAKETVLLTQLAAQEKVLATAELQAATAAKAHTTQRGILNRTINKTAAAMTRLNAAFLANPLTALLIAFTGLTAGVVLFGDKIQLGEGRLATLGDVATAVWNKIKEGFNLLRDALDSGFTKLKLLFPLVFRDINFSVAGFLKFGARAVDAYLGFWIGLKDGLFSLLGAIGAKVLAFGEGLFGFFADLGRAAAAAATLSFDEAADLASSAVDKFKTGLENADKIDVTSSFGEAFTTSFENTTYAEDLVDGLLGDAEQIAKDRAIDLAKATDLEAPIGGAGGVVDAGGAVKDALDDLRKQGELLRLSNNERQIELNLRKIIEKFRSQGVVVSPEQEARLRAQLKVNAGIKAEQDVLDDIKGPQQDLQKRYVALYSLLRAGKITSEEYRTEVERLKRDTLPGINEELAKQAELLKLSSQEREIANEILRIEEVLKRKLNDTERAGLVTKLEGLQATRLQTELLEEIVEPMEVYASKVAALGVLLDKGKISQEQFNKAVRELKLEADQASTDFATGFENGLLQAQKGFEDFATTAASLVTDAFQELENVFVEFVKTGELSFDRLIDSILANLARLAAQQLLGDLFGNLQIGNAAGAGGVQGVANQGLALLADALGAAFGGAAAQGAPVTSNKSFLVGEQGPELFTPPSAGRVHSAEDTAAAMGAARPATTVYVVNVSNMEEAARAAMEAPEGAEIVMNHLSGNPSAARQALS